VSELLVSFALTPDDYIHAFRGVLHQRRSTWAAYGCFTLAIIFIAGVALLGSGRGPAFTPGNLAGILCGALVLGFIWWHPRMSAQQLLKNNRLAVARQTWQISGSGIVMSFPGTSSTVEWSVFLRAREDERFLYLYVSELVAHLVPKRALAAEQLQELRAIVRAALGDRAQLN